MAKKFYTEGMTVSQILSMDPRELQKLNTREVSRALRTVSLAANKRIARLRQYAKKTPTGYAPKGANTQIATDALNWVPGTASQKQSLVLSLPEHVTRCCSRSARSNSSWE